MTIGPQAQCTTCVHYRSAFHPDNPTGGERSACAAFPAGIPDKIYYGSVDHRQPVDGDHGVHWESNGQPFPEFALANDRTAALTAAAEVQTGAMIALVPSEADAQRLAVDEGEPVDQLHATMVYLGEAADWPPDAQADVIAAMQAVAEQYGPVVSDGFSVNLFNPTNDERDTCIVLGLSGTEIDDLHSAIADAVTGAPDQHAPWVPHLTLIYTDDHDMVADLVDRTGDVTFDHIRVAFAGDTTDIPLGGNQGATMTAGTQPRPGLVRGPLTAATAPATGTATPAPPMMPEDTTTALSGNTAPWWGVMTIEGEESGDGREFAPDSLTWADLPMPFMWQKETAHGGENDVTVQVGLVTKAWRDGNQIMGAGVIDLDNPDGAELNRQMAAGYLRYNSVDVDMVKDADIEYVFPDDTGDQGGGDGGDSGDGGDGPDIADLFAMPDKVIFHAGRIRGTTVVSYPAFVEAVIQPGNPPANAMTAAAVGPHKTGTDQGTWDAGANEKNLPSPMPEATARAAYAWIDDAQVADGQLPKTAGRFIHHNVGTDGQPGAANTTACSSAIGVLNGGRGGTTIPGGDVQGVYNHLAAHMRDAGLEPPPLTASAAPIVAAGHTITIPDLPPVSWFAEPTEAPAIGALQITEQGRVFGYLAPAHVSHRGFRGQRLVTAPRNVDYSEFMNKTVFAHDEQSGKTVRLAAGNITFGCGHADPQSPARADPGWAAEHYDNSCSIAARIRVGENAHGTWVAGALLSDISGHDVERMVACALSGDWQGGKLKGALLVPVEGFPQAYHGPSVRVAAGAVVASAVPVRMAPTHSGPDLRPALERLARQVGRDRLSRMAALQARVNKTRGRQP